MSNEDANNPGPTIKQLFDACCDLSPAAQNKKINSAAVSDEIKAHVRKLLQHTNSDIEMTQAVVDSMQVSLDIKPISQGMKIGAYELQHQLGEGGQGEVWLAERTDGDFNHQVAIKFLKPIHDQRELNRFRTERELLAQLKHRNIAQLLDGGEIGEQRPYMVLELIEGLPLLEYAAQQNFSLKQYLTCFLQICDAVSYAHSLSVIHRDIKPLNIFVTHDGTVKLLDFGIAKYLDQESIKTETLPMMTLAYSSPEQVTGAPVSTATDIYTLGLLLYEMLTGQRAQAYHTDVPAELIHEITQGTPIPPSHLIQTIDFNRAYGNKQLKGDLDNLILMAIRKEPERRYATVKDMANDVKNYLDGKPLVAVGDSWLYRSKKFITRNPLATVLTTAVLVFLTVLPLILLSNQQQLTAERDKALAAQQQAQQQSTIANRTTDFLVSILESASPLGSKGEAIDLDDVLKSAERQLSAGLDDQPVIKATLMGKLASIQHHLGHHDQAIDYYLKVLALYKQAHNIPGQATALGQLGIMAYFANDEAGALKYKQLALALTDELHDPKDLAWHHIRIATIDGFLGKDALVNERLQQTLKNLQDLGVEDDRILGRIYNELGNATADDELALNYITLAADYAARLSGKMHPLFLIRQQTQGRILKDLERYTEAEAIFIENRENTRKLFTNEHPNYSSVIAELGALYHDKGRFKAVEEIYQEAIQISLRAAGKDSLDYVLQINNLAYLYEDMGRYDLAEVLFRESIQLRQAHHAINPYRVASSRGNLARLLAKMGHHQESQNILDEIMPVFTANNKSNRQNHITAIANLIGQNPNQSTCQAALKKIEALLPAIEKVSSKSWRRMWNELQLGELAFKCNNHELAETLLTAAAEKSKIIYTEQSDGQKIILSKTAALLAQMAQY